MTIFGEEVAGISRSYLCRDDTRVLTWTEPMLYTTLWAPPIAFVAFVQLSRKVKFFEPTRRNCTRRPCLHTNSVISHQVLKGRNATALLKMRDAHNLISAIASLTFALAVALALNERPASINGWLCTPVTSRPLMVKAWYWSKMYEWVDTAMLIAGNKELSTLHYNHHLTTATVVAAHFVGRTHRTSIFDVPMLLNAVVHTLMYTYYWRPIYFHHLKRFVTLIQIVQHVIVLACIAYTSSQRWLLGNECDVSALGNGLCTFMFAMYLVQFVAFYGRTYKVKAK